ncbi:MAG: DUF4304 domain-containing protein [Verrucomicrobiota bacterium]|nr:DUF4304 domain-containing protein [Verrucomicrobiota bacterium]
MDNKIFKKIFDVIAKKNGFESAFGGWFKQSEECIFTIQLTRSNFGNYYMVEVKTYIQGAFGNRYFKDKSLLRDIGDIFRGEPKEFEAALNLEQQMEDEERTQKLESLFQNFIVPFSEKALTKHGIYELAEKEEIYLLPAVKEELEKLKTI